MTAAFWWYVLAGFLVGFCVSTAWEWLYYRQRRMRITDRRIAELQQALRAQARETPAVEVLPQADVTWSATGYRSPGVFMENEATDEPALKGVAAVPLAGASITYGAVAAQDGHGLGNGATRIDMEDTPPWFTAANTQPAVAEPAGQESAPDERSAAAIAAAAAMAAVAMAAAPEETDGQGEVPTPGDDDLVGASATTVATAEAPATTPAATAGAVDATGDGTASANEAELGGTATVADERAAALAKAALATAAVAAALTPADESTPAPADAPPDVTMAAVPSAADIAGAPADDGHDADLARAAVATAAVAAALASAAESAPAPADIEHGVSSAVPKLAAPPQVTTEVRGFSARPGYIVSELSPGEFAVVQSTQKARRAVQRAWQQARAFTDYLRNV